MSLKPKSCHSDSPAAKFAATVAKLEHKTNAVKLTPGHGVAGRHATRALLDALSGNKDPGMFGRMFPTLAAAQGQRRQAAGARQRDDRLPIPAMRPATIPTSRPASPISASSSTTTSRST